MHLLFIYSFIHSSFIYIVAYSLLASWQAYEGIFERNKGKYGARKDGSDEELVLNIH
jgi:hypothetical protein